MPELLEASSKTLGEDEYFDGNDVKTYSAQKGHESYQEMRDRERAEDAAAAENAPAEVEDEEPHALYNQLLERARAESDGTEAGIQEWMTNYSANLARIENETRQRSEELRQTQMQEVAAEVVERHDAKQAGLENARGAIDDSFEDSQKTDEGLSAEAKQWIADRMPQTPGVAPQEATMAQPGPAIEKKAPKPGLFERRRMDASKKLMARLSNAAGHLAGSPKLSQEERDKYAQDARNYSKAATDFVMGDRRAMSRAELKGNRKSLARAEDRMIKDKHERGHTLTKDEKKRLAKLK